MPASASRVRVDAVASLLAPIPTEDLLFFAGCSEEQIAMPFDYRVVLTAPEAELVARLRRGRRTRTEGCRRSGPSALVGPGGQARHRRDRGAVHCSGVLCGCHPHGEPGPFAVREVWFERDGCRAPVRSMGSYRLGT